MAALSLIFRGISPDAEAMLRLKPLPCPLV
jgi:hypothetical protein